MSVDNNDIAEKLLNKNVYINLDLVDPEVTISHHLNELPLKVEVQVRVYDSGLKKYVYFLAMGSAQKGNDNTHQYGGVVYVYNRGNSFK
jgi:hypothetical protein